MTDRKRYLELCQMSAVGENVVVEYGGIKYKPTSLSIWFDDQGKTQNTAVLTDMCGRSIVNCRLQDVICIDNCG